VAEDHDLLQFLLRGLARDLAADDQFALHLLADRATLDGAASNSGAENGWAIAAEVLGRREDCGVLLVSVTSTSARAVAAGGVIEQEIASV
jgi:hypothetical protein